MLMNRQTKNRLKQKTLKNILMTHNILTNLQLRQPLSEADTMVL